MLSDAVIITLIICVTLAFISVNSVDRKNDFYDEDDFDEK